MKLFKRNIQASAASLLFLAVHSAVSWGGQSWQCDACALEKSPVSNKTQKIVMKF